MSRPVRGHSNRSRSPHGASSRSRHADRGRSLQATSSRNKTHNGAGSRGHPPKRSPSPHGVCSRSRSPHGATSRSRHANRGKLSLTSSSSNKPRNGAGSRGQPSSRSRSPHGVSSRSRPADRGRSPLTSSSRNKTHNGTGSRGQPPKRSPSSQGACSDRSMSPQGAFSRSKSPHWAFSRSWPADRGRSPLTSSSRNKTHNGAGSRGQPPKRSPSPQGAVSRSPSPQGATSRSPSPQGASSNSGDRISPSVSINQYSEDEDGVSATSPGADADPTALSSHRNPDQLYGVKVSNLIFIRNNKKRVKKYLTKHFMPYGKVFCVTLHGSHKDSFGLVFYTQKHEQKKALTADTTDPLGIKFSVELWSGPPPSIFWIRVTNIEDNDLSLRSRIESEFGIFGEITKVQMLDFTRERSALVVFKDRKGLDKALDSPSPIKTSFGNVTVTAWNKPPPTCAEMYGIQSPWGASSRGLSPHGASSRSQSCQGAISRSRQSPQVVSSNSGDRISPFVSINQNSEDKDGVSATSPGADADPTALSLHENPDRLYGVKVTNFYNQLKSINVKKYLTKHFMPYGNVVCVTMHGSHKDRFGLVFYKHKHEQEKALTADTTGPFGIKFSVELWSSPPPSIFGIRVTNIEDNNLYPLSRIKSEFGIFGEITKVQIDDFIRERYALVVFKDLKGQRKALASPSPIQTSFGKVIVTAWNKPPPTYAETHSIRSRLGASSRRSPSPEGASSDRSPSPDGASSSKSPSPQGASSKSRSCRKISKKDDNRISQLMTSNQSIENEDRASTKLNGVDVDLHEPHDKLYGVKVTNFEIDFINIKSYLTKHFMPYGNVVCVNMHGTFKDRYGLVFYKQKHEREKALKADTNGPLEKELCITPWNGAAPCIFGIVVTDINDNCLDLLDRVRSEFSIFGAIALVLIRGLVFERFALVFYKDRKGQEKALATQNPFKTSFGEVTLHAWNRPPPSKREMSNDDILMAVGYSPDVAMLASQQKDSPHQPASGWIEPPEAVPPRV